MRGRKIIHNYSALKSYLIGSIGFRVFAHTQQVKRTYSKHLQNQTQPIKRMTKEKDHCDAIYTCKLKRHDILQNIDNSSHKVITLQLYSPADDSHHNCVSKE
jgi:hypothetical protein